MPAYRADDALASTRRDPQGHVIHIEHVGLGKSISSAFQLNHDLLRLQASDILAFTGLLAMNIQKESTHFSLHRDIQISLPDQQRLNFVCKQLEEASSLISAGKQLDDGRILSDHSLPVHLMLCLRRGKQTFVKTLASNTITLYMQLVVGKTISLDAEASDILCSVEAAIRNKEDITPDQWRLTIAGNQLQDGRTLSDHHIQKDYTLPLMLRLCGTMQIFVKTMPSKTSADLDCTLYDETSDAIDNVKAPYQQYVIFADKQLAGRSFSEVDIQKEPTVYSLPSLREGMQVFVKTSLYDIQKQTTLHMVQADIVQPKIPGRSIPTIRQRLIFAGKQFKDDHSSSEYDIHKTSILHLVLSLCEGMIDFEECINPSIPP